MFKDDLKVAQLKSFIRAQIKLKRQLVDKQLKVRPLKS